MKLHKETGKDSKWVYYDVYEFDENTGIETFLNKSLRMTDELYNVKFGILSNPTQYLKTAQGWDIALLRWNALVSIYDDNMHALVWDLHAMVPQGSAIDVNAAVDIVLSGKKIQPNVVRDYLTRLSQGQFTKQDGKDILARIEAGEDPTVVYADKKYEKIAGIDTVVKTIYDANADKFTDPNTRDRMASWLVGQVMKETKGKCNPQEVKTIIDLLLAQ